MNVETKLGLDVFKIDEQSHIEIDHQVCREQCQVKVCLYVCPAQVYKWNEERGEIHTDYEGCLECGTCWIACEPAALTWHYPRGGFGVQYRFG